ncbi:MAG TPA: 1-phosphofructokinase family hexose kinase [Capsulimonadaceae bacterium]|jgi:tagatose 6-phosphate kinase
MKSAPTLLTITLNPAVDRNYEIPGFQRGGVHVAANVSVTAGGKGINVARVWQTLGGKAIATGFVGGTTGDFIVSGATAEGIACDFVRISDNTRMALILEDGEAHHELIVNERGPSATADEQSAFLERLPTLLRGVDFVAICGSAPVGVPPEFYGLMVTAARSAGAVVLLDAAGDNLRCGTMARPNVVKPNRDEATGLGAVIDHWGSAAREALKLSERYGIESVLVSGGGDGAVIAGDREAWAAGSPAINVVSTIGCGDSMAAGMLWGLAKSDGDRASALRWAVAAGTANALTAGAGYVSFSDILSIWGKIDCTKLA